MIRRRREVLPMGRPAMIPATYCSDAPAYTPSNNTTDKQWSFSIAALEMIDFNEISRCLSYSNPLAFVTVEPKEGEVVRYAVVHDSIWNKASVCNAEIESLIEHYLDLDTFGRVISITSLDQLNKLKTLVQKIKDAPYHKDHKLHAKVNVVLPKVS